VLVYARLGVLVLVVAGLLLAGGSRLAGADGSTTERVSVDSTGNQGNGDSAWAAITDDGRYAAFESSASNLVPGDTALHDVFVHDRQMAVTEVVSVDSAGNHGGAHSFYPAISGDGRFVAFESYASNLVPSDTNGVRDVFVHDRQTGVTERVSVDSAGNQGNSPSYWSAIGSDGRYVAFTSAASNLVPGDTNGKSDVFVHDRQTGITERVSVNSSGNQGNDGNYECAISGDGRYVAFTSVASNLVPGDTNGEMDVFVHDRQTGVTERVSVDSADNQDNGRSWQSAISADGRHVAFASEATNLVTGDTNGVTDIFLHDRQTGVTERVSVDSAGNEGNGGSFEAAISGDGRYVAFESEATNLVPGDTNGEPDVFAHDRGWTQPTPTPGPGAVGGIAEYPDVARAPACQSASSGSSAPPYVALVSGLAAAALALAAAGGWYARRRWLR
jgi:archaellum component FlaF (FlaF/FlaG flagellin family)